MYNKNEHTLGMGEQTMTLEGAVSSVLKNVYGWMAVALAITAAVAMGIAATPYYWELCAQNQIFLWLPMIVELGLVVAVSAMVNRLSFGMMALLLAAYSALNGVTMAAIFLVYTEESVATTFLTCAGTFGAMCLVGHTTKTDMTSWGKYFLMGLIGIIIASVVNWFVHSSSLAYFLNYAGVLLFVGLTAYDAQKIKSQVALNYQYGAMDMRKVALMGSLTLYLDFINLFLYLLRIMGSRKD